MKNRPHRQRFNSATRIINANRKKDIRQRAEKTFKRLMIKFLECIEGKDAESKEIQDRIAELNAEWIAYCSKSLYITEEGKKEFMIHVNKALEGLPALMTIPKAPEENPAGTPSQEN